MLIIPIASETPLQKVPHITYCLLVLLAAVWGVVAYLALAEWKEHIEEGHFHSILATYGYVDTLRLPWTYLTSSLVHLSPFHLIGNMLFIWMFGCFAEEILGKRFFLLLLLGGAICGDLAFSAGLALSSDPSGKTLPLIGASDIVTAIFGATLILRPDLEFKFLFFMLLYFRPITHTWTMPAWMYIPAWVFLDLLGLYFSGASAEIAHTAHAGGLIWGLAFGACSRFLPGISDLRKKDADFQEEPAGLDPEKEKETFEIALAGKAWKAAYEIYRRMIREKRPLQVPVGQVMTLADQLTHEGDSYRAAFLYRQVYSSAEDRDVRLEAALRLVHHLLQRENDIQAAKQLLRSLHQGYKDHLRYPEVLELIRQVKQADQTH